MTDSHKARTNSWGPVSGAFDPCYEYFTDTWDPCVALPAALKKE
jgi:hypothetical protein